MGGRRTNRWWAVVVCLALCVGVLAACKQDAPRTIGNVATARFRLFGGSVRADRRHPSMAQRTRGPDGKLIGVELSSLDPVMTQAVDISHDGTYKLRAGPIDINQFDPEVFGIQPPTDAADTIRLVSGLSLEGDTVTFTVQITGLHAPYPGFRVWVY
ncbi:MAG: hypothetical protein ACXV8G_09600 [Acidimicrobiales bacterium]